MERALAKSLLSNFLLTSRTEVMDSEPIQFYMLHLKSSKLIIWFDSDPEASKHSYILKGEVYDHEVTFDKGIRIGMSQSAFYKKFFDYFPVQVHYSVVVLVSCIDDIKQVYTFKDDKLYSVVFTTDSYWKVDY
ncbi:hypothetical protein LLH06_00420 [Mucilaginibacter daejeonensis]|uniref:hypothetical protein n=1 Tax=Mucilaginibacter daejeonensis TaxID=398049 RepID=UPI001D179F3D|nr:hypothetical protein [Mucilaginibacter daejeonensis]UEG53441.1 hypothetical protein LLH06_00420 [Mucilaginibacter daejeonensis]